MIVIADEDSALEEISAKSDLLISCGDIADHAILKAAKHYEASTIFAVKGNHDSSAPFESGIDDLHLEVKRFGELRFGGFNGSWKYKPAGNYLYEQEEVSVILKHFPRVDVFIAHNSPRGIHDKDDEVHHGFNAFADYIERTQPALFIHGHQHVNIDTMVGTTKVVGVYGAMKIEPPTPA